MRRVLAAAAAALVVATGTATTSSAATAVSSNWAGYAVSGATFTSVSGSWTQPAANCASTAAGETASAFWVGLGGNSEASSALEQTGTEADCSANGTATYSAWYELVPAASVKVPLKVSAGDKISASVKVTGRAVTVQLRNLTSGKSFAKTLRMAAPDVGSAEWIAESPAALTPGGTRIMPLTDFGAVRFSSARATSTAGHTGTISDSAWSATRIGLVSEAGGPGGPGGPGFGPLASGITGAQAVPSTLSSAGSAFTITWSQAGQT